VGTQSVPSGRGWIFVTQRDSTHVPGASGIAAICILTQDSTCICTVRLDLLSIQIVSFCTIPDAPHVPKTLLTKSLAKILMRFISELRNKLSPTKRHARKDSRKLQMSVSGTTRDSLNKMAKTAQQELEFDLVLAKNSRSQSIAVLEKKLKFAQNIQKLAEHFSTKAEKRQKVLDRLMTSSDEQNLLRDELVVLKHIASDEDTIEKLLEHRREHDLKPLIAKANMVSKMIIAEERAGAINPAILKQFQVYESSILERLKSVDAISIMRDEFKSLQALLNDLKKETAMLKKKYNKGPRNKNLMNRIEETIAEQLILENVIKMSAIRRLDDHNLMKNSLKIYDIIDKIHNLEQKEKDILKP